MCGVPWEHRVVGKPLEGVEVQSGASSVEVDRLSLEESLEEGKAAVLRRGDKEGLRNHAESRRNRTEHTDAPTLPCFDSGFSDIVWK